MPSRPRTCIVCPHSSKYTCATCSAFYCSVTCYNQHKDTHAPQPRVDTTQDEPASLSDPAPLRPLTALRWPYVPDTSAYPDPLTRDDPKPLQLHQYEALATSPAIRAILGSHPHLCDLLTSINALRGAEREEALQRALGVDSRLLKNDDTGQPLNQDTKAFRAFAEAVEVAVRGGQEDVLGLDWD